MIYAIIFSKIKGNEMKLLYAYLESDCQVCEKEDLNNQYHEHFFTMTVQIDSNVTFNFTSLQLKVQRYSYAIVQSVSYVLSHTVYNCVIF